MKKIITTFAILSIVLLPGPSEASTTNTSATTEPVFLNANSYCDFAEQNLYIGITDSTSNGRVTYLQNFLVEKGLLVIPVGVSTGYFGPLTRAALSKFQAQNGISPAVGYFGPITRGFILASCSGPAPEPQPGPSAPSISSMNPTSGKVGTAVTISGTGFSQTGNTIHFGNGVVANVSSTDGKTLSFNVPDAIVPACTLIRPQPCLLAIQITLPGTYPVMVLNASNQSTNSVNFTVTGTEN